MTASTESRFTHLECSSCGASWPRDRILNLCPCGKSLFARYELSRPFRPVDRPGLWRYAPLLPVLADENVVSLGEGWTPLLRVPYGKEWFVKEEGPNPTGSFKARGMAVAISKAKELGIGDVCVPTAGNAGGACAAYAARARLRAHVYLPMDAPPANLEEVVHAGARVTRVDGTIADAARRMREDIAARPMFDVSTLKEPYRVEGKKTMGYELFEQLGGRLPDVIVYPAGGGTGLIGMWKAFGEMEQLGWIGKGRPRMVAVQAEGCQPLVRAFREGRETSDEEKQARTIAAGLRVPKAFADGLILRILRESRGAAAAVSDDEIRAAVPRLFSETGLFACPEGAACLPAALRLKAEGWIRQEDSVVLFNTGTGLKYLEALRT
jgi:threonine synthase